MNRMRNTCTKRKGMTRSIYKEMSRRTTNKRYCNFNPYKKKDTKTPLIV